MKKLSSGFKKNSGRSNLGRITVFTKGSRFHNYTIVDYARLTSTDVAVCIHNLKNTSTNNILSLIKFSNGSYAYILNTYGYSVGMYTQFLTRHSIFSTKYNIGDVVFLKNLQIGCIFFGVCNMSKNKASFARAPGTYCTLLSSDDFNQSYKIQLPSGSCISVFGDYSATLGRNSNI
jgi:ribosomal protein L2